MGRPPIGKQAMSDAERQRRHRAAQPVTKTRPAAAAPDGRDRTITALKARIAELEGRVRELEAELVRARNMRNEQPQPFRRRTPEEWAAARQATIDEKEPDAQHCER
jgi:hypothetical protein